MLSRRLQFEEEAFFAEWDEEVDSHKGSSREGAKVTIVRLGEHIGLSTGGAIEEDIKNGDILTH